MADSNLEDNDNEVQVILSDLLQDTDNPLSSIKNFEDLNLAPEITQGLIAMNFRKPSKVQERALPLLLSNPPRNMIAQSQSGTGKTAAFVIAVLSRIDYTKPFQPQALILAPTRELARQIEDVVNQVGHFIPELHTQAAVPGGIDRSTGVRGSVVVGTPGTVMDAIKRKQFDARELKILVIDEADNMLDSTGLGDQAAKVKAMIPQTVQVLLFSATFPEKVDIYAKKYAPNAHSMKLRQQDLNVKGIKQMYMDCPSEADKYDVLVKMYSLMTVGSSVIFVKTRESASIIEQRMREDGHKIAALHGAFDGNERDRLLQEFRAGTSKVLITTNVMARGIDVSSVNMVINYDIPMRGFNDAEPDPETYLHRIGRTGRFGRVGVSISFVSDKKSFDALQKISQIYEIELQQLTPDDWDRTERKIHEVIKSNRAKAVYRPDTEGDAVQSSEKKSVQYSGKETVVPPAAPAAPDASAMS